MINKDDGLSILNGIIQCSENKFDLSNNENLEYFMKSYPPIDIYKKYHSNLSENPRRIRFSYAQAARAAT